MCECVQEQTQKEKTYVLHMMDLRNHINEVTKNEEEPLGETFIQKRMIRPISVGLQKDTVRVELKSVLKDPLISDEKLSREVNQVVVTKPSRL